MLRTYGIANKYNISKTLNSKYDIVAGNTITYEQHQIVYRNVTFGVLETLLNILEQIVSLKNNTRMKYMNNQF